MVRLHLGSEAKQLWTGRQRKATGSSSGKKALVWESGHLFSKPTLVKLTGSFMFINLSSTLVARFLSL